MSLQDGIAPLLNQNTAALITESALAAGTVNSADQDNPVGRGVLVVVDATVDSLTNYTVTIQGKDPVSGKYYTLLASAALVATGTTVLTVYPGCIAAANAVANLPLPRTWRVTITSTGAGALTLTVGASVIL